MVTQRGNKSQNSKEYEPTICPASTIRHPTLLLNNNRASAENNVNETLLTGMMALYKFQKIKCIASELKREFHSI